MSSDPKSVWRTNCKYIYLTAFFRVCCQNVSCFHHYWLPLNVTILSLLFYHFLRLNMTFTSHQPVLKRILAVIKWRGNAGSCSWVHSIRCCDVKSNWLIFIIIITACVLLLPYHTNLSMLTTPRHAFYYTHVWCSPTPTALNKLVSVITNIIAAINDPSCGSLFFFYYYYFFPFPCPEEQMQLFMLPGNRKQDTANRG